MEHPPKPECGMSMLGSIAFNPTDRLYRLCYLLQNVVTLSKLTEGLTVLAQVREQYVVDRHFAALNGRSRKLKPNILFPGVGNYDIKHLVAVRYLKGQIRQP
jgi:hypothetical protein